MKTIVVGRSSKPADNEVGDIYGVPGISIWPAGEYDPPILGVSRHITVAYSSFAPVLDEAVVDHLTGTAATSLTTENTEFGAVDCRPGWNIAQIPFDEGFVVAVSNTALGKILVTGEWIRCTRHAITDESVLAGLQSNLIR